MADLTSEELRQVDQVRAGVRKAGKKQTAELVRDKKLSTAKWKIQVWIKSERSITKPLSFTLTLWESGKRLHGGGDETAFICRRKPRAPRPKMPFVAARHTFRNEMTNDGCGEVIPGDQAHHGRIVCPGCGLAWDTEHISDAILYNVPVERAADIIADWYRKLGHDADLYVKYRDQDVRVKMMAQAYGIKRARELKGLTIYPQDSIIRDTSSGATLESRFKALLLA